MEPMPRQRRRRSQANAPRPEPSGPTLAGRRVARAPEWRWRTFPVFFTLALSVFVTAVLATLLSGSNSVRILVVLGAAMSAAALSHFITVRFIAPRMKPRPRD
jgi:uncharacterized MAPEG superfamily protein